MQEFDPSVWGPHYWFFLMTIALSYPDTPTAVTKRKYYDFIQNIPIFIPNFEIGNKFSHLLDKYPVSPYLDNRESFVKWIHFIHNKINEILGKPEISYDEAIASYFAQYKPTSILLTEKTHTRKYLLSVCVFLLFLFLIYMYYE